MAKCCGKSVSVDKGQTSRSERSHPDCFASKLQQRQALFGQRRLYVDAVLCGELAQLFHSPLVLGL